MTRTQIKAAAERVQPLNRPRRILVDIEESAPCALHLSGRRIVVDSVIETWRIEDEWWREKPVSRIYWRVALEDGRVVDVYHDLALGKWWRQAY
jgi:hypothetical protein